jgi:simple sugar transport system substrate-binding protein
VSRAAARLAAAVLALAVGGCGTAAQVREPDLVVRGATPGPADADEAAADDEVTIAVVTHGQASSQFWTIVRNGIDAAERQMDVDVEYRSPDVYDIRTMTRLIDTAVARDPDGLVVSIPDDALAAPIRRAIRAGIPVVSINSGSDVARRVGTLAHIGQPEEIAGYRTGQRLASEGARSVLCVNQEPGNEGLDRRCAGVARAMREAGGRSRVLGVDDNDRALTRLALLDATSGGDADTVLTLNNAVGEIAAQSVPRRVRLATFDYSPAVLAGIRSGRIAFAVDQQPYLQGYLPVVFLAERERYGLFPAQGEVVPTGPSFVTRETAAQAARLSRLGIR